MTMNTASVSVRTTATPQRPPASWDTPNDTYVLKPTRDRFTQSIANDLNGGRLSPDVSPMLDAVLWPGKHNSPQVQVKTFAVDGIQAKDIIFIQRVPPVPGRANVVLFIPEKDGSAFQSFKTVEQMNTWLKTQAKDPQHLERFTRHFAEAGSPRAARVTETMTRFNDNDINAIVGPYANEGEDIFARLDKDPASPPVSVNGLTHLKQERSSAQGRVLYSGQRPDGEKVLFQYDAYGNFLGQDKKGQFYFVENGLNNQKPLVPMSASEFKRNVQQTAAHHVGADDVRGLVEELLTHLEHPAAGIGDALQVFGVSKNTANTLERYLDNPFSAVLLDLNKHNQIGQVFGLDKASMDAILKTLGDVAQGFVPYYGQARALSALLAKALRNEPLDDQEKRDLADGLGFKPNSPARKHLPKPPAPRAPSAKAYAPETVAPEPKLTAEAPAANRLRPSQWADISAHAVADGEQLIAGVRPNGKGLYQVKAPDGTDRWLIRLSDDPHGSRVFEIDHRFKLSDGYVRVIDPQTRRPLMTVHSTGDGGWAPVNGPGGVKWPWQSERAGAQGFDPGAYDYPAEGKASTSKTNEKIDNQLKKDADTFHKKAKTKPRPVHPAIPRTASLADVINTLFKKTLGIIIGEDHSQSAGLRVLIDNAAEFKQNNVTTLYSEGFDHALQPDLDRFHETGEFSPALIKNLNLIDRAHSGHGPYTNKQLLITLRAHGIRVKAIDVPSVEPKSTRLKNMNYYATQVIESDQAANPGGKWIARVGSDHVFSYDGEPPVRGLSELTGATGVSVDDAPANKGTSVTQSRDKTEVFIDLKPR